MPKKLIGEWSVVPLILNLKTRRLASRLSQFTTGKWVPVTHGMGSWMGPRFGVDALERERSIPTVGSWNRYDGSV